jgi:hypothetical protein
VRCRSCAGMKPFRNPFEIVGCQITSSAAGAVRRWYSLPGKRPLPFKPIDPRTGELLQPARPSGTDPHERGLSVEARRFVAETEAAYASASPSGGETESNVRMAPIADGPADRFDGSSEFTRRGGTKQDQHRQRPRTVDLRAGEDDRSIEPLAERSVALARRIDAITTSATLPLLEQGYALVDCLGDAVDGDLELPATACEAMIGVWFASLAPNAEANNPESPRLGAPIAEWPFFEVSMRLYLRMRATFSAPTASVLENLTVIAATMTALHGPTERVLSFALQLMDDSDRCAVLPSRVQFSAFFDVCAAHRMMDVAIRRFAYAQDELYVLPDSNMCTSILRGLARNDLIDDAVAFLARVEKVPVDVSLLNTTLEVLSLSQEPLAAFAAYEAAVSGSQRVVPNTETFSHLLTACQRLEQWDRARFVLREMQVHRVRGDSRTLNLLLKGLVLADLLPLARVLLAAMRSKGVEVWPALAERAEELGISGGRAKRGHTAVVLGNVRAEPRLRPTTADPRQDHRLGLLASRGKLGSVPAAELLAWLEKRGVVAARDPQALRALSTASAGGHVWLARRVHKELLGVSPTPETRRSV